MTGDRRLPLLLTGPTKDYLWGGRRLVDEYGREADHLPAAEAWVCSTHPDGESGVLTPEGEVPLCRFLREHPDVVGTHPRSRDALPILVKLIDAKKDLSVQVHPDDAYAAVHENGQSGKTELWYVLHASPGACLVYGFRRDVTADEVRDALSRGKLTGLLNRVPVRKGDVFYIQAGQVHAIGEGIVIAEIQQSSNLTYRLYDYDRIDKDGKLRPLHVEKALDVANLRGSSSPRQPMRVLNYVQGIARELLGRCRYFQVERLLLNTEERRAHPLYATGPNSFRVLLCVAGCGAMFADRFALPFFKGDCIFVPASSEEVRLHGRAELLEISC